MEGIHKLSRPIDFYHSPAFDNFIVHTIIGIRSLVSIRIPALTGQAKSLETVKYPSLSLCAVALVCMHGVQAQVRSPVPAAAAAFLANPTHCAVLIGGADHSADGADRVYGEMLAAALTGLGTPLPAAVEWMRNACASGLAQPDRLSREVL